MVSVPLPFFSSLPILTVISSTVTPVTAHPNRRDPPEREDQANLGLPVYGVDQRVLAADRYRDLLGGDRGEVVPVTLSPGQQERGGGLDGTAAVRERRGEEQHPADNAHRDRRSHGFAFSVLPERERRVHTM